MLDAILHDEIEAAFYALQRDGIFVFQSLAPASIIKPLKAEALCALKDSSGFSGAERGIDPAQGGDSNFSKICAALSCATLRELTYRYDAGSVFCTEIIAAHDTKPGKITDVHFDMAPSLKCMIYLSDVTRQSAAFRYSPGTHHTNRAFRADFLRSGGALHELPNVAGPDEPVHLIDVEGPAGTVLLFDTSGFHTAGILDSGSERLLLRSRSLLKGHIPLSERLLQRSPNYIGQKPYRFLRGLVNSRVSPFRVPSPPVPLGRQATRGNARAAEPEVETL